MRKIEREMIAAILDGKDWRSGNTAVRIDATSTAGHATRAVVHLHGHCIARLNRSSNTPWQFNLCGWNTPTTRSRINAIAREFGTAGVSTVRGVPVSRDLDGDSISVPLNGWF